MAKKLTANEKATILKNINVTPVKVLIKYLSQKQFLLKDYIDANLDLSVVDEIEKGIEIEIKKEKEKDDNLTIINKKVIEDNHFYKDINNNKKIIQKINQALLDKVITEEGLLKNTFIDEDLLQRIKAYDKIYLPPSKNETDLLPGTDIFFIGKSGSGKTCVLASIFNYAKEEGIFQDNPISLNGMKYKNMLVQELKSGILPERTPATEEAVTFITTDLHLNGEINPLNFVEMSGEFFTKAAKDPNVWKTTVDSQGYLSNDNKKLLFYIVDFKMKVETESGNLVDGKLNQDSHQDDDFGAFTSMLENYQKALKNTYCIYIVVNKSDLFPEDVIDKNAYAKEFFKDNFTTLYRNLQDKQKKYGFELRSLHFSLGNFVLNNSFLKEINFECPSTIIESISKQSARKKPKGWLSSMFSSNEDL